MVIRALVVINATLITNDSACVRVNGAYIINKHTIYMHTVVRALVVVNGTLIANDSAYVRVNGAYIINMHTVLSRLPVSVVSVWHRVECRIIKYHALLSSRYIWGKLFFSQQSDVNECYFIRSNSGENDKLHTN